MCVCDEHKFTQINTHTFVLLWGYCNVCTQDLIPRLNLNPTLTLTLNPFLSNIPVKKWALKQTHTFPWKHLTLCHVLINQKIPAHRERNILKENQQDFQSCEHILYVQCLLTVKQAYLITLIHIHAHIHAESTREWPIKVVWIQLCANSRQKTRSAVLLAMREFEFIVTPITQKWHVCTQSLGTAAQSYWNLSNYFSEIINMKEYPCLNTFNAGTAPILV